MTDLMPLWALDDQLLSLLNSIEVCDENLLPELQEKIAEYVQAEARKVDHVGAALSAFENTAANAKSEIERLRVRQQSAEKAAERLKEYVLAVLRNRDGKPLRGNNVTFSTRRSESLIVDDAAVVPAEWKQITTNISIPKDPLKRAIKDGAAIPGVHIEERLNLVRK